MSGCPDNDGLRGDALYDMRTSRCSLSVYKVTDAIDLERISVAYAATKEHISEVGYFVFEGSDLESFGITVQKTKGDTADNDVNDLHRDLGNLTVRRLVNLAEIVSNGKSRQIPKSYIKTLIYDEIKNGILDTTKIKLLEVQKNLAAQRPF